MTTELRLNAQVVCADGPAGHLTDVILDPISDQVTHLVVEVKGFGRTQHLVPVTLVQATSTREVRLQCSRAELRQTEFFTEAQPIPLDPSTAALMVDDTLAWPLALPQFATLPVEHERVPPGELAVHRDTRVEASDGPVGRLEAFVLQSEDDRVADVILRRGHFWRRSEVVVPANAIHHIDAEGVHLNLPKAGVHALPVTRRESVAVPDSA
jgi:uncharacterized protein YrrD